MEEIGLVKSCPPLIQEEREPKNAREQGLFHEESARKAYQGVVSHTHHKLKLVPKGYVISPSKPFLGASVGNIQKCQCSDGCPVRVVEYKRPWKQRDLHPKQAFLTPEWSYSKCKKVCTKIYFKLLLSSSASNVCKRPHPVNLCCVDQQGNLHC